MTFHANITRRGRQCYALKHPVYIKRTEVQGTAGSEKRYLRLVEGEAIVYIDERELIALATKAAMNKGRKARVGPIEAVFTGINTRTEVPQ